MIPILTDSIDSSEGFGRLTDAVSCSVAEEKNGSYTLEMIYPVSGDLFGDIRPGRIIRARTGDGKQSFDIETTTRIMDGLVSVQAVHVSYRLNYIHIRPCTVSADNLQDLLAQLKNNCIEDCPFEFKSSVVWTEPWAYTVSAPTSFRAVIGGIDDCLLTATKTVARWDNMTVYIERTRNADNGTITVQYGRNLTDLDAEDDLDDIYTAVLPYYLDHDGNYIHGSKQRAASADDYPYDRTLLVDMTRQFDSIPTAADLNAAAVEYVENNGIGLIETSIEVDIATIDGLPDNDSMGVGTPVRIVHNRLSVNSNSEIINTTYDVLHDRYDSLTAGKARNSLAKVVARNSTASKSNTEASSGGGGSLGEYFVADDTGLQAYKPIYVYNDDRSRYAPINYNYARAWYYLVKQDDGDPWPDTAPVAGSERAITSGAMYPADVTSDVTDLGVSGVTINGLKAYTIGKLAWIQVYILLTSDGVSSSWVEVLDGLPIPVGNIYNTYPYRGSSYGQPLDVSVGKDGGLYVRNGSSGGGYVFYVNLCYPIA